MNRHLEDLLNDGLDARSKGQPLSEFLAHHQENAQVLEPLLQTADQIVSTIEVAPRAEAKRAARYAVLAYAGERPKSKWAFAARKKSFASG